MSALASGVLARGPWPPERVVVSWRDEVYVPADQHNEEADRAIAALAQRGSPSHDGLAARLAAWQEAEGTLRLELQPMRWALRLGAHAAEALSVLCVIRRTDGRWLAGRRAPWVASWPARWALGAGGAVEVAEDPVEALTRELAEEWSLTPERFTVEALVVPPDGMALLIGLAWVPAAARVVPDAEHDEYAWWPADVDAWPPEADDVLRRVGRMLAES